MTRYRKTSPQTELVVQVNVFYTFDLGQNEVDCECNYIMFSTLKPFFIS